MAFHGPCMEYGCSGSGSVLLILCFDYGLVQFQLGSVTGTTCRDSMTLPAFAAFSCCGCFFVKLWF